MSDLGRDGTSFSFVLSALEAETRASTACGGHIQSFPSLGSLHPILAQRCREQRFINTPLGPNFGGGPSTVQMKHVRVDGFFLGMLLTGSVVRR